MPLCACVCVCVSRYRRRHTDRELSPSACTDVYLGMGGGSIPHIHTSVASLSPPWALRGVAGLGRRGTLWWSVPRESQDSFP